MKDSHNDPFTSSVSQLEDTSSRRGKEITSILSYIQFVKSGNLKKGVDHTCKLLLQKGPATRRMLSKDGFGKYPINHITKDVYVLKQKGIIEELEDKMMCPISGRLAKWVRIVNDGTIVQGNLFCHD